MDMKLTPNEFFAAGAEPGDRIYYGDGDERIVVEFFEGGTINIYTLHGRITVLPESGNAVKLRGERTF